MVRCEDNEVLSRRTLRMRRPKDSPHADALHVSLQDHASPVRYRNVWVRELDPRRP